MYTRDQNGLLTSEITWQGRRFFLTVVPGRKPLVQCRTRVDSLGWLLIETEVLDMDEKLERELLVGEIRGYIEILNAKGIDSPLRSLESLDTMSILDLRILSRRLRDMARTPAA